MAMFMLRIIGTQFKGISQNVILHGRVCACVGLKTSSITHSLMDARDKDHEEKQAQLTVKQENFFDQLARSKKVRDKQTFLRALQIYLKKENINRRGHVEFITASLNKMKEFGVHRDINVYRAIIDLFPKGKMVPETSWQVEFMHYPKQQNCCIEVLDQMEHNGVIPDDAMGYQLISIFGDRTHVFRKYRRMMYWLPKFKYANPYYVPYELPDDRVEIAKLAMKRMSVDVDMLAKVNVIQAIDVENSYDDTFIVSSQSPEQRDLLKLHPPDTPLYVEGGFNVWLRQFCMKYFILRSKLTDRYLEHQVLEKEAEEDDTNFKWNFMQAEHSDAKLVIPPSKHEQEDGTILGMCITGTSSKDSLASWVKCLQRENPSLEKTPVVFLLKTPEGGLQTIDGDKPMNDKLAFHDGS